MFAHQVIEQQDRKHSGQGLRQEDAKWREAEDLGAGRLQPKAQGRLVNRDEATWVKGNKKEIMPVIQHTSNRRGIIKIGEAVLPQLKKVHEDRD